MMRSMKMAVLAGAMLFLSMPTSSVAASWAEGDWKYKGFTQWHAQSGGSTKLGGAGTQCFFCKPDKDGDDDRDGVLNRKDQCPTTPPKVKVDARGCAVDTDGDGVADYLDVCPLTPPRVKVEENGCPVDADGDGVADYLDQCPGTPRGDEVDSHGCSDLDKDGDGVLDVDDRCPNTPKGATVTREGCWVISNLRFRVGTAVIDQSASNTLDSIVTILQRNPSLNVDIQGHTDSMGQDDYNQNLSEDRARSTMEYLVGHGIDRGRLTTSGYGESNPIGDNETNEGRAENRRVELRH